MAHCQITRDEITFTILNEYVKDNDTIDLEVRNHSSNNYYIPIINNNLSEKLSCQNSQYFFLHTIVFNQNGEQLPWNIANPQSNCEELDKYWEDKKVNFKSEDFILLKSQECIKIKVSFHSVIKVCDYAECSIMGFKNFDKKNIYIGCSYHEAEVMDRLLSTELRESLELMGYKLYEKYVESNRVPIRNE